MLAGVLQLLFVDFTDVTKGMSTQFPICVVTNMFDIEDTR
jgi:hypothetical protein